MVERKTEIKRTSDRGFRRRNELMRNGPRIEITDLLEEIMDHHVDNGISRAANEFVTNENMNKLLVSKLERSRQATEAILGISASTRISPPIVATALHVGIAYGMGIVLEALNEREHRDTPDPEETIIN
jgi:hypothetical protein